MSRSAQTMSDAMQFEIEDIVELKNRSQAYVLARQITFKQTACNNHACCQNSPCEPIRI